jgi:hypothetical protein
VKMKKSLTLGRYGLKSGPLAEGEGEEELWEHYLAHCSRRKLKVQPKFGWANAPESLYGIGRGNPCHIIMVQGNGFIFNRM